MGTYCTGKEESTDSARESGLDNCYCNYLAICRYFSKLKTFSVVDKIYYIFFEKLNYSTAFFPVLLYYHYHHHCCQAAHYYCYDYFIYYYISIFKGLVGLSVVDLIKLVGRVLVTLYTVGEMSTASDFALH